MTTVVFAARLGLAGVFALAGAAKLADRHAFEATLVGLGVQRRSVRFIAVSLPLAELAVAALLVPTASARAAAAVALVLLVVFCAVIALALRRGAKPDCGCFGAHPVPAGRATLARNAGLAGAAVLVLVAGPGHAPAALSVTPLGVAVAVLAVLVAALGSLTLALLGRYGRLLERVAALEEARDDSLELELLESSTPLRVVG